MSPFYTEGDIFGAFTFKRSMRELREGPRLLVVSEYNSIIEALETLVRTS